MTQADGTVCSGKGVRFVDKLAKVYSLLFTASVTDKMLYNICVAG